MKLESVVKALGSLCLLLADGFPGTVCFMAEDFIFMHLDFVLTLICFTVSEDESPEIIGPHRVQIKAHPGEHLFLHCEAFANCEADMTIIYWLVNGSFPEETPSSGRIVESEETAIDEGTILQKSLLLKNVTKEDLKSTFTCVVTNAAGTDQKHTTLVTSRRDCNAGKHKKH
ncbi:interleukin-1 receptor type 2-like isoform X1 [Morone saxatilis]|uniref:interleukin-1 receptor type 2-like isoform X1 n=1 Tax=Morone saxatilis TaxID=34816 RepID=UPI0015E1DD56|nr:interleukin-1 receptor type 2-like isoform X1 [Morone saxatilis]